MLWERLCFEDSINLPLAWHRGDPRECERLQGGPSTLLRGENDSIPFIDSLSFIHLIWLFHGFTGEILDTT